MQGTVLPMEAESVRADRKKTGTTMKSANGSASDMLKMKKRITAIILCLILIITVFPVTAMAGSGDDYPSDLKSAEIDSVIDPWRFYNRECTSFVAWCLNSRNGVKFSNYYGGAEWGNANHWGVAAKSIGIPVNSIPAVGAVAWDTSGNYGHVAWVSAVGEDKVTIEEYNIGYSGLYNTRTVSKEDFQYIHIKDLSEGQAVDDEGPEITDITISDISSSGYTITCRVSDPAGIQRVQFPTWTVTNDQDDLLRDWWTGESSRGTFDGETVSFRVDAALHNNETGRYITHIYAFDLLGNYTCAAAPEVYVHDHDLQKISAKAATCTETGNTVYWKCKTCGCCFSDAEAEDEIAEGSWVLPAIGHEWGEWFTEKEPSVTEAGSLCRVCRHDASHIETKAFSYQWKTSLPADYTGSAEDVNGERYFLINGTVDRACTEALQKGTIDRLKDVKAGDWYYAPVVYVVSHTNENGTPLMKGYAGETSFGPGDPLTRGMFATILYRYENEPAVSFDAAAFSDVTDSAFYAVPAIWAGKNGYIKGYEDGRFGGEDNITREQLAVILYRYAQGKGYPLTEKGDLSRFADSGKISSWAVDAIIWAVGTGIISGKTDENGIRCIDSQGTASRAECAAMIQRFIAYLYVQF